MKMFVDIATIGVISPNFKKRLSGVTSTIQRVVSIQARSIAIATLGPGLADDVPSVRFRDLWKMWRLPSGWPCRIWHARRNIEMLAGILLRDVLRMPLRLVFTSASQREHTAWTRWLIRRMDAVIATSERTHSYLKVPAKVIGHGINVETFAPAADKAALRARLALPDRPLIGCFGRIRHQKGTDVFVDAMIAVLRENPAPVAVILGRAVAKHQAFQAGLVSKVEEAGLKDRILFAGEVPPEATPNWYRALDLYVAPQRWEGFGVTPLEAMASGVPVVATRVGAFDELVADGVTGSLITPGAVNDMAAAVSAWIGDQNRLSQAAQAARRRAVDEFSIEEEAAAINAVYLSVIHSLSATPSSG